MLDYVCPRERLVCVSHNIGCLKSTDIVSVDVVLVRISASEVQVDVAVLIDCFVHAMFFVEHHAHKRCKASACRHEYALCK